MHYYNSNTINHLIIYVETPMIFQTLPELSKYCALTTCHLFVIFRTLSRSSKLEWSEVGMVLNPFQITTTMATRQSQRKRKNAPTRLEAETQKPGRKCSKDSRDSVFIPFLFHSDSQVSGLVAEVPEEKAKMFLPILLPNFIKAI